MRYPRCRHNHRACGAAKHHHGQPRTHDEDDQSQTPLELEDGDQGHDGKFRQHESSAQHRTARQNQRRVHQNWIGPKYKQSDPLAGVHFCRAHYLSRCFCTWRLRLRSELKILSLSLSSERRRKPWTCEIATAISRMSIESRLSPSPNNGASRSMSEGESS